MNSEKIILGIDPGTNVMGYGLLKVTGNKAQMMAMGVIDMRKQNDPYLRLGYIFVQSMLKLGRAQGVAIAAAIHRDIPIHEYAPLKIKMAITGNGSASKEQVAGMLKRLLMLKEDDMPQFMDATDALGAAYCHFLQASRPESTARHYSSWKDFAQKNEKRIKR